uniref:Uncharacterized protein n=1 Tax=Tetranychus urticae TaxID=32264 RepID=T1JZJ2_TETUR
MSTIINFDFFISLSKTRLYQFLIGKPCLLQMIK